MMDDVLEIRKRILFKNYLLCHPAAVREYQELKFQTMREHPNDRIAYTEAKSEFVEATIHRARAFFDDVASPTD